MSMMFGQKKLQAQAEVPRFSEKEAENLLRKAGYQILGKNQKETIITIIDGKEHFGYVETDYLVRKNKRKYAVMVHVGEGSPDPHEPTLRRRILEHHRVFSRDGVLVLDPNQGRVHLISFRFPHEWNIDMFFRFLIGLFIILLVIGIIWMLVQLRLF
ncbi:MAG: hypothetical protein ABIH22_02555 [Candidatus Margulisiibacteriota bacterium]